MKMMIEMSRLAKGYGLELWIWYPAMDKDYGSRRRSITPMRNGATCSARPEDRRHLRARRRPWPYPAEVLDVAAGEADGEPAPIPSEGADVDVAAGVQCEKRGWTSSSRSCDGQPTWLSGVAFAPQNRPASRAARRIPKQYPIRFLPRHHAQSARQYPAGLGCGVRAHAGPRTHQPAAGRSAHRVPALGRMPMGLHHVFRRLQRRCQQSGVERVGLGSGCRSECDHARLCAVFHRRMWLGCSARGCWRWSATGAAPGGDEPGYPETTLAQFQAMGRRAAGTEVELAIPAGAVSRVLRRRPARTGDSGIVAGVPRAGRIGPRLGKSAARWWRWRRLRKGTGGGPADRAWRSVAGAGGGAGRRSFGRCGCS